MARAYIVLTRNDLTDGHLQILDLKPNVSQRNNALDPKGQTTYKNHLVQNDTTTLSIVFTVESDCYGLTAYLLDRIENPGAGTPPLSVTQARAIADSILERATSGLSLTLTDIDTVIDAEVSNAGLQTGDSFGEVEDILKILSGEVFLLPEGSVLDDGLGGFNAEEGRGYFVSAPNVIKPQSVSNNYGAVRGKSTLYAPTVPRSTPVQTGTQNVNYRAIRKIIDTSELHLSVLAGQLSLLTSESFSFINPSFTYGAGGTATDLVGTELEVTGLGRAVAVYDADGNNIG
jgi:hypothetical protein